jgi:hypothetical protein
MGRRAVERSITWNWLLILSQHRIKREENQTFRSSMSGIRAALGRRD